MYKLAKFIVEKRAIFFLLFAVLIIYSALSISKVNVEYSISSYLPQQTDTAKALDIMEDEFVTYGTTKIMIKNITYEKAESLYEVIKEFEGVKSFTFENSPDYYKDSCALFNITFTGDSDDPVSVAAFNKVQNELDGYDFVVPNPLVTSFADTLAHEMVIILLIAAAVILLVLMFTSKSFAEVLVFPIIFGVAALLNMGTNYWLGTISFISNTVCIVLQLALAIDYAIILCHRFTEEKELCPSDAKGAMINALAKSIPEISSSSLTTISGLVALMFMQLRLGYDLGMVLAKSIIFSLITVFLLMPGLMLSFSKLMDKSRHRNFVPKIHILGRAVIKVRYVLLAAFVGLFAVGAVFSQQVHYVYSENAIYTNRPTATMTAVKETEQVFGYDNMFVILVPKGDYGLERQVLDLVESDPLISNALGISNIEITEGYYLSDNINYRDFATMTNLTASMSMDVFRLYALLNGDYWATMPNKLDDYRVTVIELLDFVFENEDYVPLSSDQKETFDELKTTLQDGEAQLIGDTYTRLIFNIDGAVESEETFMLIERLIPQVKELYPQAIFAGESMSAYDLNDSFVSDNLLITLLTIAFIYIILMFTFRSWGIPLVLVLVIQGAIFLNFSVPVMMGTNLFFFVYLIVSAIQMGATIDYAILITNRFRSLKTQMNKRDAIAETLSACFPTVFTSGSIMSVAAFLIGGISSEPLIASIGMCLGRGTLISIASVMIFLPVLLYVFDKPLEKTVFHKKEKPPKPKDNKFFASTINSLLNQMQINAASIGGAASVNGEGIASGAASVDGEGIASSAANASGAASANGEGIASSAESTNGAASVNGEESTNGAASVNGEESTNGATSVNGEGVASGAESTSGAASANGEGIASSAANASGAASVNGAESTNGAASTNDEANINSAKKIGSRQRRRK